MHFKMLRNNNNLFSTILKTSKTTKLFQSIKVSNDKAFEEIRIPVPWGHLAGKWWGPKDKKPIFTFHGWQDNCGSFDLLIPSLPKHLSFLALDLPGHGLSSNFPPGFLYSRLVDLILYRRLQTFFGLEKIALMGHSLGAINSYTFAGLYPEAVDFLICIDGFSSVVNAKHVDHLKISIDRFLNFDNQIINELASQAEPRCYKMKDLEEVMFKNRMGSVDKDKCKYLLARNIKESKSQMGMYYVDQDQRNKTGYVMSWSIEDLEELARRITCPILGTTTGYSPAMNDLEVIDSLRNIIIKKNPRAQFYEIKEKHHGHLNKPELFTDIISGFIDKYNPQYEKKDLKMFEKVFQSS